MKKKGGTYNHGASNMGSGCCGYASPKGIGTKVSGASPDGKTPSFGQGSANGGGMSKGKKKGY